MAVALLDTNAVSDLMRDHPNIKARIANHSEPIATSAIVLGELRYGLDRLPAGRKQVDLEARSQAILAALRIETVTETIAHTYGRLKATLEAQGLLLDDNDLWIAATVVSGNFVLVTRDQAFLQITQLQVEDWST